MSVTRLPGNYLKIKQYKESKKLPDNIEQQLKEFHNSLPYSDEISMGYADIGAILVHANNSGAWTIKEHEAFCSQLNLILVAMDRHEHYEPRQYSLELDFLYIPKFDNEDYNEMASIRIDNILRF